MGTWRKGVPGRWDGKCKGSEVKQERRIGGTSRRAGESNKRWSHKGRTDREAGRTSWDQFL